MASRLGKGAIALGVLLVLGSRLLFPIEGMPTGAQYLAAIIPLTYFLWIVRGIILKGVGFVEGLSEQSSSGPRWCRC